MKWQLPTWYSMGAAIAGLLVAITAMAGEPSSLTRSDPNKPNTSAAAKQSAIASIPLDQLTPSARNRVSWVLENAGIFRRLPIRVVPCDAEFYLFLVRHPDVVVNIWEFFGASHITVRQTTPDRYEVTDDAGTTGTLEFLYRGRDLHIVFLDGTYSGKVLGHQVRARGIIVLKSAFIRDAQGRCYTTSRLDTFLNIEPSGAEFLTKTFQPLVGKVADGNFTQTAEFVGSLSRTAEVNPRGMQRLAARLTQVSPDVRQEFTVMIDRVAQRAGQAGRTASLPPARESAGQAREVVPLVARRPADNDARDARPANQ